LGFNKALKKRQQHFKKTIKKSSQNKLQMKAVIALILLWGVCVCLAAPSQFDTFDFVFKTSPLPSASSNFTCTKNSSCVGKGATCGGFFDVKNGMTYNCSINSTGTPNCCAANLYCVGGKCVVDNAGATCSSDGNCLPKGTTGQPLLCISGICTYVGFAGDKCTNNSQCLNLPCNNSVCSAPAVGQSCNLTTGCGFGLYCGVANGSQQCIALPQNGSNCVNSMCYPGYFCKSGTCIPKYSLGVGKTCFGYQDFCSTGLTCDPVNGTCVTAQTSLPTCTNGSDCSSGVCICSFLSGKQFCAELDLDPCTSQRSSLDSCLVTNLCTHSGDGANTCSYANCYSEFKKAMSCSCTILSTEYSTCYYNSYCGGFPVWAIIVIIVVIIVLILAVVLIVFFLMRRRRQYDTI